jgi:hypothetical protein
MTSGVVIRLLRPRYHPNGRIEEVVMEGVSPVRARRVLVVLSVLFLLLGAIPAAQAIADSDKVDKATEEQSSEQPASADSEGAAELSSTQSKKPKGEEPEEEVAEPEPAPVISASFTCTGVVVDSDKGLSNITVVYTDGTSFKTEFNGPEQYHWGFTAPEGKTIDYIMVKAGNPDAGGSANQGQRFDSNAVCEESTQEPTDEPTEEPTDEPTEEPTEDPTEEPTEPVDAPVIDGEFNCTGVVVDSDKGLSNITVVYTDGTSFKTEFNGPEQYHWEFTAPEGKTIDYIMVKAGNPNAGEHSSDGETFENDAVCEEPTELPDIDPTESSTEIDGPDDTDIDDKDGEDKDGDDPDRPDPKDPRDPKDPKDPDGDDGIGSDEDPKAPEKKLPATGAPLFPLSALALGSLAFGGVMLRRTRRPAVLVAEQSESTIEDIAPAAEQPALDTATAATGSRTAKLVGLGVLAVVGVALIVRARRSDR